MSATDSTDFTKAIEKHERDLAAIKAKLDEQAAILEQLTEEYEKLGIDTSSLPSIESLPQEYQEQYMAFARDLAEVDNILRPQRPKSKPALKRRRNMI
jgi:NAD(P)H-nitrite reductase large subunit